jgi:hypothetical protein
MKNLPANIAWRQISIATKMACGAREPSRNGENELNFKVHSKPYRYIKVEYLPGLDLYEVEYYRIKRGSYERVSLEVANDVYADMLSEIIYHMVNK